MTILDRSGGGGSTQPIEEEKDKEDEQSSSSSSSSSGILGGGGGSSSLSQPSTVSQPSSGSNTSGSSSSSSSSLASSSRESQDVQTVADRGVPDDNTFVNVSDDAGPAPDASDPEEGRSARSSRVTVGADTTAGGGGREAMGHGLATPDPITYETDTGQTIDLQGTVDLRDTEQTFDATPELNDARNASIRDQAGDNNPMNEGAANDVTQQDLQAYYAEASARFNDRLQSLQQEMRNAQGAERRRLAGEIQRNRGLLAQVAQARAGGRGRERVIQRGGGQGGGSDDGGSDGIAGTSITTRHVAAGGAAVGGGVGLYYLAGVLL